MLERGACLTFSAYNKMEITKVTKENLEENEITAVFLEAVLMPNGEIVRYGKSIEWIKDGDFKGIFKTK